MWILNLFYRFMTLLLILLCFLGGWFWIQYDKFLRTPLVAAHDKARIVLLSDGMTTREFSNYLARLRVIKHPRYFELLVRLAGAGKLLKAGEYALEPGMKPNAFLRRLKSGEVIQHQVTFIEGWHFQQVMTALREEPAVKITLTDLRMPVVLAKLQLSTLAPPSLEGRLFPDTYRFPKGTLDIDILKTAYQRMQQKLQTAWAGRDPDLPYRTPYQALIVASIIEKETAAPAERALIAGVLLRRLKRGIPLQIDATVIYGLGQAFDRTLSKADLKHDTPYNTYRHLGLPPTPIAMPSAAALNAAMHPDKSQLLYFVARGDGTHQFSKTLHQHNLAVREYRLNDKIKK